MANRPATVTVTEIKRTVQGAIAAGFVVGRIEVDHVAGKVNLFLAGAPDQNTANPWDTK